MATWVDGVAEGMVTNRANSAEHDASRARADARSAQGKADRAESRADQAESGQILLLGKINELRDALAIEENKRAAAIMTVRAVGDIMNSLPPVERERFRDVLIQKTRAKFDEFKLQNRGINLYDAANSLPTLKSIGVV